MDLSAYNSVYPMYFSSYAEYFCTNISITTINRNFEKSLEMLEEAVRHPTFPQQDLKRVMGEGLTSFVQTRDEPSSLADRALLYRVYAGDPNNRLSVPISGIAKTYASVTREDLLKFYHDNYTPEKTSISVCGKVDPEQVLTLLEKCFGDWESENKLPQEKRLSERVNTSISQSLLVKIDNKKEQTIYVVDRPGSSQSIIRVGCVGYARNDPQYFPLTVMGTALGGSFMSRLNQNLRERNGYAYGSYGYFLFDAEPRPFIATADVQTDKTIPAVKEILKEIRFMKEPLSEDELERTKKYICYSFPHDFETTEKLMNKIRNMQLYGLPDDYYSTYVDNIMAVDQKSMVVPRVSFFGTRPMEIIVVGDAKVIAEQLKD